MSDLAGEADDTIRTASQRLGRRVPDLVVRSLTEQEIWAQAPVLTCDRIHWETDAPLDAASLLADLPPPAWTRLWSDGKHRIWVPAGSGEAAREAIRELCQRKGQDPINLRVDAAVGFRDLDLIDADILAELLAAAVEWLYPRTSQIRRRLMGEIDGIDEDDVRQMMYLFVSDLADRYDGGREGRNGHVNFLTYLLGKMRTWPQDVARTAYGRGVMADRLSLARAAADSAEVLGSGATDVQVADLLGVSVTELRRRQQAVVALGNFRHRSSLDEEPLEGPSISIPDEGVVIEQAAEDYERNAALTRAILAAVDDPARGGRRAQDPLALAALYLVFWEGLSRPEAARALDVQPKTVAAATARAFDALDAEGLR